MKVSLVPMWRSASFVCVECGVDLPSLCCARCNKNSRRLVRSETNDGSNEKIGEHAKRTDHTLT